MIGSLESAATFLYRVLYIQTLINHHGTKNCFTDFCFFFFFFFFFFSCVQATMYILVVWSFLSATLKGDITRSRRLEHNAIVEIPPPAKSKAVWLASLFFKIPDDEQIDRDRLIHNTSASDAYQLNIIRTPIHSRTSSSMYSVMDIASDSCSPPPLSSCDRDFLDIWYRTTWGVGKKSHQVGTTST